MVGHSVLHLFNGDPKQQRCYFDYQHQKDNTSKYHNAKAGIDTKKFAAMIDQIEKHLPQRPSEVMLKATLDALQRIVPVALPVDWLALRTELSSLPDRIPSYVSMRNCPAREFNGADPGSATGKCCSMYTAIAKQAMQGSILSI
jgi:hypothetical protein